MEENECMYKLMFRPITTVGQRASIVVDIKYIYTERVDSFPVLMFII